MKKRYEEPPRLEQPRSEEFRLVIGEDRGLLIAEVGHNNVYWLVGEKGAYFGLYQYARWRHGFNPIGIPAIQAILGEGERLIYTPCVLGYHDIDALAQYVKVAITQAGVFISTSYNISPYHEIPVEETLIEKATLVSPRRMHAIICGPWWRRIGMWMRRVFKSD